MTVFVVIDVCWALLLAGVGLFCICIRLLLVGDVMLVAMFVFVFLVILFCLQWFIIVLRDFCF